MTSKIYTNTVSPLLLESFHKLSEIPELSHCRLVGGTALSLLFGHRLSIDIDLFTDQDYQTIDFQKLLENLKEKFPYVETSPIDIVEMGKMFYVGKSKTENIKVDVFYTEPFIGKAIFMEKRLPIASLEDIIPMKLNAVMSRGSRKDFWDLHEILERYSMEEVWEMYENKFPYHDISKEEIEKMYNFDRANYEGDSPTCLKGKYWELIRGDIEYSVKEYLKENRSGLRL